MLRALLPAHELEHALHPLPRVLAAQEEAPTALEQKRRALDVGSRQVVDEDLVDVQDCVRLSNVELGELAVITNVLSDGGRKRWTDQTLL